MGVEVLDIKGKKGGSQDLNKEIFAVKPNDHAIYLDVKQHLANRRQGTHKAKEVSELSGSTRKIKKQKGTGTARAGSIKSPLFKGGARIFGPRPRNYGFKLNKKLKLVARKSAFTHKAKENNIIVLKDFKLDKPSTKAYADILSSVKANQGRSLLLVEAHDKNTYLSARNIPGAEVKVVTDASTYDVMKASKLLITQGAVKALETALLK